MLRHIVTWNYKDGLSDIENKANALKVKYELESLITSINGIIEINVYINEFTSGLLTGLLALVVIYIIRCQFAIRDDEKLKKLYIKETDERALFIYQKSGSIGMNISVAGLLLGTLVCAYINIIVAATLLGACLFISLIRGFLKLYYRKHI